jgi:ABC-2 type transport system ATP-binding protein
MIWDFLLELRREHGRTIILVTHNVLEAERVIERVGIINHGHIIALGTPGELKGRIDRRIHLDVMLAPGHEDRAPLLAGLGEAMRLTDRQWAVLVPRERVEQAVGRVVNEVGLQSLDDFRILTPSLEDVYLQLAGEPMEAGKA